MGNNQHKPVICVIGLGYVGLPLARAFSENFSVIGFDTDAQRIESLKQGLTRENLTYTGNPEEIGKADFIAICVPTPVTHSKEPDLSFIKSATATTGQFMKKGCTVILESTVYPGLTEEVMKPILEEKSGLKCGRDFRIGYSPERINPGDDEHSLGKMTKVVAGMDEETSRIMVEIYSKVAGDVFPARNIRTAEAAKVIENIQRDLNIALMNELAVIFDRMGINTSDVLEAAATKWNFHKYSPGLVGGHCIPVDPYYMVYRARELDYHPQVILAGRAINDAMPGHVALLTIKALNQVDKVIKGSRVLIMGLTYKENVADTRETPAKRLIKELHEYGVIVEGYDPLLNNAEKVFGITVINDFAKASGYDAIIVALAHDEFVNIGMNKLKEAMNRAPILVDVRGVFDRKEAHEKGIYYCCL